MTTDHNEAMSQLPHKLATLIKCLPQAPFRDHLAAECIKQAERIAELERLSTGLSTVYNEAMDSLRIAVDERDTLRAELETERMRLVACGVVAMANTAESAAKARDMHPDYLCASVRDVAAAVDREMALRAEVERLKPNAERYEWLRDVSVPPHNFYVGVPVEFDGVKYAPHEVDAYIDTARKATP